MIVSSSRSTAGDELRRLARRLAPAVAPYYLHSPRGAAEPAPGWYWQPAGAEHPQYLAYNRYAAYAKLSELVGAAAAAQAATS